MPLMQIVPELRIASQSLRRAGHPFIPGGGMRNDPALASVAVDLSAALGLELRPQPAHRATGGSISECYKWDSAVSPLFVKVGPPADHAMFAAEAAGLEELCQANAVRVPGVRSIGRNDAHAWLALEWRRGAAGPAGGAAAGAAGGGGRARQH